MHRKSGPWFLSAFLLVLMLVSGFTTHAAAVEVSIYDIQYTADPSGDSPYEDQEVTTSGIVTAVHYNGYVIAEEPGPWHAVFVYSDLFDRAVGDEVEITGTVDEYYGMTEIVNVTSFQQVSTGNPVVATSPPLGESYQEQYEAVLLSFEDVFVAALLYYGEWLISDGTSYLVCDDLSDYLYFPKEGDALDSVTGVLFYSYGSFKLEPRGLDDIQGEDVFIPHYALHGHVVTMNDARDVIIGGYVEVVGDKIVAIGTTRPDHIPVIDAGGLIFPGLIDPHNHPSYNVLGVIPFTTLFTERYEWQADSLYDEFQTQYYGILNYGGWDEHWLDVVKLAEIRAMTAGTTTMQGLNCNGTYDNAFAHPAIGINNAGRFPAELYSSTFPLDYSELYWYYKGLGYWDNFAIHLSEGTSAAALDEYYGWRDMGMLDERTSIIHGVPYTATEWAEMGTAGANLIWSPVSNMVLYGATADIPGALAAGINVALSPDWTESGSRHLLDEMKAADQLDNDMWGDVITPQMMTEFVTRNAARAVAADEFAGQIAVGYRSDFMVIPGSPKKPYDSLMRANPRNVKLTVVNGYPRYGNPDQMAMFPFLEGTETITIGGEEKTLAIQVDAYGLYESDKPISQILSELQEAYDAVEPKVCDFLGLE